MLESFLGLFYGACISGFIGNRADATAVYVAQNIAQKFKDRKIINNDIQKALNRSFQYSLKSICEDCLNEVNDEITYKKGNSQLSSNLNWLKNKRSLIENELKEVEKKDYDEPTTEVLEVINFLLVHEDSMKETLQNVNVRLIERAIGKDNVPECYRKSVEKNILSLMYDNFTYEIKTNPAISSILEMQLLIQNDVKIDAVVERLNCIWEILIQHLEPVGTAGQTEPNIEPTFEKILSPLNNAKEHFKPFCDEYGKKDKRILVVGDVMLDCKIKGTAAKYETVQKHQIISRGGAVYMVNDEPKKTLGGAADIAMAFSEISNVVLIGVIGLDYEGYTLKKICKDHNIQFYFEETPNVKTTTKIYIHRLTEAGAKRVIRFDSEDIQSMTNYCNIENVQNEIINEIKKYITKIDCIVIKDHQKGMISKKLVEKISEIASNYSIPLYVDPKYAWEKFRGVAIEAILPNMKEAASALYDIKTEDCKVLERDIFCKLQDTEYANLVKNYSNCKNFAIKAASKGALIVSQSAGVYPKVINPVIVNERDFETDVGCGDIFDAFTIIGMLNNHTLEESVLFANFVAGLKTKKSLGECMYLHDIKKELEKDSFENYIKDNLLFVSNITKKSAM